MKAFAAYYNDDIRKESSSGGVFTLLAEQFDVVYGVAMSEDCYSAEYIRVQNEGSKSIAPLRGSKYLQAKVGNTWENVKKDLEAKRKVLVSGTSCQINGLKLFLGKEYEELYCVDVICHGVPSPKLWEGFVKEREKKYGRLQYVNFRYKNDSDYEFSTRNHSLYIAKEENPYMRMFLQNYCLRPSCYTCKAKEHKLADLTIGDYWGIKKDVPEMADGGGTSLVIARTEKGQRLFDSIKSNLIWKEVQYETAVSHNSTEFSSVKRPVERNYFFTDLNRMSYKKVEKKYTTVGNNKSLIQAARKLKLMVKIIFKEEKIKSEKKRSEYGMLLCFESAARMKR